jgi:Xaa-Pro aminopeptidase
MEKLSNKDVRERRLVNFRKQLKEIGIDAALVTKRENYMYLSGSPVLRQHLLVSQEDAFLITDFRYIEQASIQASCFK